MLGNKVYEFRKKGGHIRAPFHGHDARLRPQLPGGSLLHEGDGGRPQEPHALVGGRDGFGVLRRAVDTG